MPGTRGTAESPVVPQENLVDQYQFRVTYCALFDPSQLLKKHILVLVIYTQNWWV